MTYVRESEALLLLAAFRRRLKPRPEPPQPAPVSKELAAVLDGVEVRAKCRAPMQPMADAILVLRDRGNTELADKLTRMRDEWARAVAKELP